MVTYCQRVDFVCLPFTKIRLESKWNTTLAAENFRVQRTPDKVVLFFRTECFKRKFAFHFFKAIFDTSFRPSRPFFGKWIAFVQMVNAIPGRNKTVLNFAYHLPKPWTDRFAYASGKQPLPFAKKSVKLQPSCYSENRNLSGHPFAWLIVLVFSSSLRTLLSVAVLHAQRSPMAKNIWLLARENDH